MDTIFKLSGAGAQFAEQVNQPLDANFYEAILKLFLKLSLAKVKE